VPTQGTHELLVSSILNALQSSELPSSCACRWRYASMTVGFSRCFCPHHPPWQI